MAEGGCAASMGNVNPNDNWQVHYRDTMRGGKFLNNWRMAELHAKEAPDRVWELETYGALFDRTPDGKISQRNFGGHTYPRLAHVGDRTGLELIRTLQQKIVSLQQEDFRETGDYEANIRVFHETTITDLFKADGKIAGCFGYYRSSGAFVRFDAPAIVLATGGVGKSYQVTSNSWEYTGDGHALALRAGATLINMEFLQFHPTGMVWPPSVKGILVTESVRGDGGILKNSEGKRFMFDYIPDVFKEQYATTPEEGDRWYTDADNNRRPPELLPRDEVARAINSEVKAGRGSPHGGVFLDIASRRSPEEILKKLPSMYHQFKELADVDITKEPMEVGPTCHYVMGGVEVDPDTAMSIVPGLFAAGEVAGGMHGSNRLGGNSLSDLLVFGRRAGLGAAEYVDGLGGVRPAVLLADVARGAGPRPAAVLHGGRGRGEPVQGAAGAAEDDARARRHHPQGRRDAARAQEARGHRHAHPHGVGHRAPRVQPRLAPRAGPAQHAAGVAVRREGGAGAAGEPRRSHPRRLPGDGLRLAARPARAARARRGRRGARPPGADRDAPELFDLFELDELKKYYTGEELGGHRAGQGEKA